MTSIDGVAAARPSARLAAACRIVSARAQVQLPHERRDCDQPDRAMSAAAW